MSRLIAFGCSFSFGHSLPDCIETSKAWDKPSQYAWPKILSDLLNYECINESVCGASNLEILYRILNFKFQQNDTVVIVWTIPTRDMFFQKYGKPFRRLGAWMNDTFAKKWMLTANEYDYIQRLWIYMNHVDLYLKSLNLNYLHYPSSPIDIKSHISTLKINNLYEYGIVCCDKAADNIHPGIESHKQTALKIFNILNDTSK